MMTRAPEPVTARALRRLRAARADVRACAGFTLVELVFSISILGIVVAAIGAALFVGLKNTDESNARLIESHDAQILTVYFPQDAASATGVRRDVTTCAEGTTAGETAIVFFKWTESGVSKAAGYFTKTVSGERQLIRRKCSAGAMVTEPVMSHNIGAADPTISCTGTGTPCPASGTGTTFTSVTISVTETKGYAYSLTGSKRSV
jgi:prepilin-type N-terminal cleavage/methylation domain-containing protein